jgi:hypothetical protein
MRLVQCTIEPGLVDSEKVANIPTSGGDTEEVVVSSNIVQENSIRVAEIGRRQNQVLIELPRESSTGRWRLWVPAANVR